MKLSVILPCFNGAATLAVQLEALTRQHWPGGWEVIVVDNGSTDDSMVIASRYHDRLPGMRIVQAHTPGTQRLGVPHSYNTGIKAASGDAFVFCEADDEVAPGWLEAMGEALTEHPLVACRMEHRKLNPPWAHPPYGNGHQYDDVSRSSKPPYLQWASGAAFGLQRSAYLALGPLSIEHPLSHDLEYCWRAQLAGYKLHFEPRAVVHYREKTRMKDRFVQGRNWGWDDTRLEQLHGFPMRSFPLVRQGIFLLRMLPSGVGAALLAATGRMESRRQFADWVWNFGWAVGKGKALAQKPGTASRMTGTPVAGSAQGD